MRAVASLLVALSIVLAGCALFSSEAQIPDHIVVQASDAFVIDRWNPNSSGVVEAEGSATIDVVSSTATGTVTGSVTLEGKTTTFEWIEFHGDEGKPSHANGINQDFQEHGATGNGHNRSPELHAVTSGWGTANLTFDGEPLFNPLTGRAPFPAHFMVTDTGVRHDESRELRLVNGSLYRPDNASDGQNYPGDNEVHVIFDTGPPRRSDNRVGDGGTLTPAEPTASIGTTVGHGTATVNATVAVSSAQQASSLGEVNVSLVGSNTTYREETLGGPQSQANNVSWTLDGTAKRGEIRLELSTDATADWTAELFVDEPERVFLHFLYETASWSDGG